jgi:hypothetical protein
MYLSVLNDTTLKHLLRQNLEWINYMPQVIIIHV